MTPFTKGPWETLAGDWDKDLEGYCRYTIKPLKRLNMADARLIDAAPLMYGALKDLEWADAGTCPQCGMHSTSGHQTKCILGNALSKADGK